MTIKNDNSERATLLLTCLILCIVAATFFSRIWDPDFFWHLGTGRWIVQNMTLPDRDPFTPFFYGTDREAAILKGYWLAQVGYHAVNSLCGTFGLAFLKSVTFVAIFALVFHYHRSNKTPFPWVLFCLIPLYETLLGFRADRPNMFSLLFFAGLLYLMERRRWKLVPLLMLIWSNMHGGYLLGDVVIVLYLGVLALTRNEKISSLEAGWAILAVGASFINPLGITSLLSMLKMEGSAYQQTILEYMSPVRMALDYHDYELGYFMAILVAAVTVPLCRKSGNWAQQAILLLTAVISLLHLRYMPFFVITYAFFLPRTLGRITFQAIGGRILIYGSTALIVFLFLSDRTNGRALTSGFETGRFPEKAAMFVARSGGTGRVFCNDIWGGYLLWQLPKATILVDTRALSEEVHVNNLRIQNAEPSWEEKLRALDATIIVISAFNPITGSANTLWQALSYSPNWQLTYADETALVYFRSDVGHVGQRMNFQETWATSLNHALAQVRTLVAKYPQTPFHWGDLGQIHALRGETAEAVKAYRKALELDPGNPDYQAKLKIFATR